MCPFCELDEIPDPNNDEKTIRVAYCTASRQYMSGDGCPDFGYETCGCAYFEYIADLVNKIVDIMLNAIKDADEQLNNLFSYLWGEVGKTNYRDLYDAVQKAEWYRRHFDFSESYNFLILEDQTLMDRIEETLKALKTDGPGYHHMFSEQDVDIADSELNQIMDTTLPMINNVHNCLLCEELDQFNYKYADNAKRMMNNINNVVTSSLNQVYQDLNKVRDNFIRNVGSVIREAKRDRGSTLRHTGVKWTF